MMFKGSRFIYENMNGDRVIFDSDDSPFKLYKDGIDFLSSNTIDLSETSVSGSVGSTVGSKTVQSKIGTLEGEIIDDIPDNRRKMIDTIFPFDEGRFIYENGEDSFYLEVQPSTTPIISNDEDVEKFQIILLVPYPFWRDSNGYSFEKFSKLISHYKYGQSFSSTEPWRISTRESTSVINIFNNNPVDLGLIVTIKLLDNVDQVTLTNTSTQETFTINRPSWLSDNIGYTYEISTVPNSKYAKIIAPDGTETNIINSFYGEFFQLHYRDNPISLGEGTHTDIDVTLQWYDIRIGI